MKQLLTLQLLREEFGGDAVSFYSADTFNEMTPPTDDPAYLGAVASAVVHGQHLACIMQRRLHTCSSRSGLVDP